MLAYICNKLKCNMNSENKKTIATKVSETAYNQIKWIAKVANTTVYNLVQVVVDSFIKCCCSDEPLNDYTKEVLYTFTDFSKINGFCYSEGSFENIDVISFFAVFQDKRKKKKKNAEVVLLKKENNELLINRNNDIILRNFLFGFSPNMIEKLERIKKEQKLNSLTVALKYAIDYSLDGNEDISEDIRSLFDNNDNIYDKITDRDEIGKYKRKMSATLSDFEDKPHRFIRDSFYYKKSQEEQNTCNIDDFLEREMDNEDYA